jgi:hypothetical protein
MTPTTPSPIPEGWILVPKAWQSIMDEIERRADKMSGDSRFTVEIDADDIESINATPSPISDQAAGEPVGEASSMPGTEGFTMAAFKASDVPVGTKLYLRSMESTERLAPGFVIQKVRSFMDPVIALIGSARDDEPRNVEGMTRAEFESHLRVCYQHDNVRAHVNASEGFRLMEQQERDVSARAELNYPIAIRCPGCDAWNSGMAEVHFVQGCPGCAKNMRVANGLEVAAIAPVEKT